MDIASLLGDDAAYLLDHVSTTISADQLTTPGPDSVAEVFGRRVTWPTSEHASTPHRDQPTPDKTSPAGRPTSVV